MRTLTMDQVSLVGGGTVNETIGNAIGYVIHAAQQREVQMAALISPAAAVVVAVMHYNEEHI